MRTAQTLLLFAFVLAASSLVLMLVYRFRQARDGRRTALLDALCLVPTATVIGTLPGVVGVTNDALRIAASIASIIVSITAVILLIRARWKESA